MTAKKHDEVAQEPGNDENLRPSEVETDTMEAASSDAATDAAVAEEIAAEDKLSAQLTEAQDKFLRLQAEWDNYRKRTAAERTAERERATERLIEKILPVVDDLGRALEHAENATKEALVEGVQAVANKLGDILEREGVEPIDPAGQPYDAQLHQAVGTVEDDTVCADTVAQVYQRGYRMGDRVLRPAMVTVASGGPARKEEKSAE
jgi:molecular chaperone GrpE